MKCQICNKKLIIEGCHSYEDYGMDNENGVVYNLICMNIDCDVEQILIYVKTIKQLPV